MNWIHSSAKHRSDLLPGDGLRCFRAVPSAVGTHKLGAVGGCKPSKVPGASQPVVHMQMIATCTDFICNCLWSPLERDCSVTVSCHTCRTNHRWQAFAFSKSETPSKGSIGNAVHETVTCRPGSLLPGLFCQVVGQSSTVQISSKAAASDLLVAEVTGSAVCGNDNLFRYAR